MRTVLQRLRAEVLGQPFARDARRALDQMAASGLWPDIDYADRSSGAWKPMRHLERLRSIAAAWAQPGNALERSAAARAAVENGLQAWLQRRPVSDNWWYNTVGAQLVLGPILLLLRDELPADVMSRAIGLLHDPGMVPPAQATGQNLIWYASQQMIRGVLRDDSDDIARASQALQREVRVTRQEGIQPDLSFHQHGAQLYSGGYGLAFLVDSTRAASLLAGTPWAFTPERLELLADYALRGIAPLVRGAWLDWGACGREYTRNSSVSRPRRLLAAISRLKPLVPSRSEDLAQLAARLQACRKLGQILTA